MKSNANTLLASSQIDSSQWHEMAVMVLGSIDPLVGTHVVSFCMS